MDGFVLLHGSVSDVGRVRDHNEDAAVARPGLYVVADGMGGHAAGEVASALTAESLAELDGKEARSVDDVLAAVRRANEQIVARARQDPGCDGMATTVTGLVLVSGEGKGRWLVFNVGDSRVYRHAAGELTQVTVDHSEVQELVTAGYLTPEQARVHPLRNTVTRCLGRPRLPPVDTWLLPVTPGEAFVVCSDGLPGELTDAQVAEALAEGGLPQQVADRLARRAVALGGRDNLTVVVVRVDAADQTTT